MVKCGKCGGRGFLPEYRGILGGKCFACKGTGELQAKQSTRYPIAVVTTSGERIAPVFWKDAATPEGALKKAQSHYAQKGIKVESIEVMTDYFPK